jgi:uncharacterized protein
MEMKKMQQKVSVDIIKRIEQLVEEVCRSDSNVFGYGIWTHHIKSVAEKAKELAIKFNADPEIVEIAAPGEILQELNYPKQKIKTVQHCIENHRGSVPGMRNTPEAECLANADAIAHIENIPSLLYLTFVQFKMDIDEGTEWVGKKIERSYKKLNPVLQEEMLPKYQAALTLLNRI